MTHLAAMCVTLGVTLGYATTALGQQYPPPIRPTHPTNAEAPAPPNFDSAENAWDENPFSGSGNVIINLCKVQCLAPVTRQTEWYGFPGGWIPRSLVVAWDYASDFFSANGIVDAEIEYSLDGGQQWTTLEHVVRTTKETIDTTETAVALSAEQDPTLVRVRAFLQIRITQCGMQCSWLDWGQVGGRLYIRDIRIEVEPPVLTATPEVVTRGDTVTFEVKGAPSGTVSGWSYETEDVGVVTRTTDPSATIWVGPVVDSGTGRATVTMGSVSYPLSKAVTVNPRSGWLFPPAVAVKREPGYLVPGCEVVLNPTPPGNAFSGMYYLCLRWMVDLPDIGVVPDGPNKDLKWVLDVHDSTTADWSRHRDYEDPLSSFALSNCGTFVALPGNTCATPNGTGWIDWQVFAAGVARHEAGEQNSHHANYVEANADPSLNLKAVAEPLVGSVSISTGDFRASVDVAIRNRGNALQAARSSKPEPCGAQCDASCSAYNGHFNTPGNECR